MSSKNTDVSKLSEAQVRSLLQLGALPEASRTALWVLDILAEAADNPQRAEVHSLVRNLQSPTLAGDAGPLSFRSLAGLTREESELLGGRTLADALTGPWSSRPVLEKLADYGELLLNDAFHPATQLSGVAIRALAVAALWVRYGVSIDPAEAETTVQALRALAGLPVLSRQLREHAREAAARLGPTDTSEDP
jgi:hypothetical protein